MALQSRWKRDVGVGDLIEYFDEEKYVDNPSALTLSDIRRIAAEIERCHDSFEYAARNYFLIVNKDRKDQLLTLNEGQELILEKIYRLRDRGKPQKLQVIKARQLGCSTLIEALIAWRSMFFPNVAAMVVSHVGTHAGFLFQKMVHIYDHLPWWMKPMIASRKEEEGLVFKNPNPDDRRNNPGLNSSVIVQAATQVSGVGEGYTINAMHFSEYCSVDDSKAREIIEGDMVHALAPNVGTFAILESTAKGAGRFSEDLWVANMDLAEKADWYPVFLPWFFEKARVVAPENGWQPSETEISMRLRVEKEWVQCAHCGEFRERYFKNFDIKGSECSDCGKGKREPYILSDEQLCWMQERVINARRRGPESLKELRQEVCTTAEEAFQLSGIAVFPEDTQEFVNETICPALWTGNLDRKGKFHCSLQEFDENGKEKFKCYQEWCTVDHRWDLEAPLQIWEMPEPGALYCIGVDIAEGLATEKSDHSVCWVNKIGTAPSPDTHVATYRSNSINPSDLAAVCNFLGRWYNEAQLSIEYNIYQTTGDNVKNFYQYPNLFRWKHYDSVSGMNSNKYHWLTQQNSKPQLWQTGVRALRERSWFIHDKMFAHEMKRFQKDDYDSKKAEAETNYHDDVIMAALIARYTSHDLDSYDESAYAAADAGPSFVQMLEWTMDCLTCKFTWQANNPEDYMRCPSPKCSSPMLHGKPNTKEGPAKLEGKYVFEQLEQGANDLDTLPEDGTLERALQPIL